jgi:hypothetical protein
VVAVLILAVVVDITDSNREQAGTASKQKSTDNEDKESPSSKEAGESIPVKIRVSGTPGTPYSCENSSFAFEEGESNPVRYTEDVSGTLTAEPVVYTSQAINKYPWWFDFVAASCRITGGQNPTGSLKAQILVGSEVKAEEETRPDPPGKKSMESRHVQPRWSPRCPDWEVDWDCG